MLKTNDFHHFIQHPHFSQIAKNLFRASLYTPADIAPYKMYYQTIEKKKSKTPLLNNRGLRG